ncbi:MAG TPA: DAK2 domain-containing protein, partial [Actinomycetota bacterium]|nr:DAK2 domain-containing protein [Actinomycetota bacterium]
MTDPLGELDGPFVVRWIREAAAAIHEHRDFLTQLDAAIGDADHGLNMDRGFAAAVEALESDSNRPPGQLLETAGSTLVLSVGGAAGPLYGSALR